MNSECVSMALEHKIYVEPRSSLNKASQTSPWQILLPSGPNTQTNQPAPLYPPGVTSAHHKTTEPASVLEDAMTGQQWPSFLIVIILPSIPPPSLFRAN